MIGTRGVPARYGGFETAVEEIGRRLVDQGHEVVVYCRGGDPDVRSHAGMALVHLPAVRHKVAETLSHTALSVGHLRRNPVDVAFVFNAANALLLPAISAPTAVHVDGLEWKRGKWGGGGRRFYLMSERLAVRWAGALIADARGIQKYYSETYDRESVYIPYGANIQDSRKNDMLGSIGLEAGRFHLVVARFEPENNVDLIVRGYVRSAAEFPLVVVGSAPYADEYTAQIDQAADSRVRLLGGVWDQQLLDQLYGNCASYLHGHSVGGTNPSLLRAMGAGAPVSAIDVVFSREVAGDTGRFFSDEAGVAALVEHAEKHPDAAAARGDAGRARVAAAYRWDQVADDYARLAVELLESRRR